MRLRSTSLVGGVAAVLAAASIAPVAGASASHHQIAPLSAGRMIVLLKAQATSSLHGGAARVVDAQRLVKSDVASLGARVLSSTLVPAALTVSVSAAQAAALRSNPNVLGIYPDAIIPGPKRTRVAAHSATHVGHGPVNSALCGTAANPQLNPEGLNNINAPAAWGQGATGKGVTVAFIADGVDTANADLQRNAAFASSGSPAGSPVISSYQDFGGDGTGAPTGGAEAFGDVSSIAAQGNTTYDLSNYVSAAHPLPAGCDIKVVGVAPGASVMVLKVFADSNTTTSTGFIGAINYAVTHGAKVINESFGSNPFPDNALDITRAANDAAVAAGVTVVVSTGDAGITSTIGSPSSDPKVIAVGASTTFRSYAQTTYGGINAPGASGAFIDNNISSLSSGGFAESGKTVDIVAPGDLNWALCSSDAGNYSECSGQDLQNFGGTSESAPLTAGAVADVISAYAAHHHGQSPTPAVIKSILASTATDISAPAEQMGAGLLNVGKATALAASMPGTDVSAASGVVSSTAQIDVAGKPGQKVAASFTLSNNAKTSAKVSLSTRQLIAKGDVSGSVTLDPSVTSTQPNFPIWSGANETYQTATFSVPAGTDRVKLASNYTFTAQTSLLHVALFDPTGAFAGYSLPQGLGDYAQVEVATPKPGTWTAVFFTVSNTWSPSSKGTSGTVQWDASFWKFAAASKVTTSATISGHKSKTIAVSIVVPVDSGDSAQSVLVKSGGTTFTIPVVVRSMVAITKGIGGFSGVLTGGNGRGGAPAQSNTYSFTVPAGQHDVDVSLQMVDNSPAGFLPADQVVGYIIDPSGQTVAYDTNFTFAANGHAVATPYLNLYAANPVPGNYHVLLQWANQVTGASLFDPFQGVIQFNAVSVTSTLPSGGAVSRTTGSTATITVTNKGLAPMTVFADPRLNSSSVYALTASSTQQLPNNAFSSYFVPPQTQAIQVSTSSTVPTTFDFGSYVGDPDLSPSMSAPGLTGSVGTNGAVATWAPNGGVQSGLWYVSPAEIGPFTGPEPTGNIVTQVLVQTKDFDQAITTSTGDTVTDLIGYTNTWNPVTIDPNSYATISVNIMPDTAVGVTSSGTVSVDVLSTGAFINGTIIGTVANVSTLAVIPFSYKTLS